MLITSEALDQFAAAMAKVQADIGGAVKGSVNPAFRSKYADLSAVWEAWQAIGPQNGFAVMQFPGVYNADAKTMAMTTLVTHSSGQWVQSELSVPLSKVDAQGYGSATTYARRYSLAAAVGICPEDDDGNAASRPTPARDQAQPDVIDDAQRVELMGLAEQSRVDLKAFCTFYKIDALARLPKARFDHARAALVRKIEEAA